MILAAVPAYAHCPGNFSSGVLSEVLAQKSFAFVPSALVRDPGPMFPLVSLTLHNDRIIIRSRQTILPMPCLYQSDGQDG